MVASGFETFLLISVIGIILIFFLFRNPEMPMTVLFPLLWLFWSYNVPWLGGRLERAIGILAIAGLFLVLVQSKQRIKLLPSTVAIGMLVLFGAFLVSSVINNTPSPVETLISLATRLVFLYLAYCLLNTPRNLKLATILLIITGLIGASFILFWNMKWGLGFFRTSEGNMYAQESLGGFMYSLILGGNFLTIPAIFLVSLYQTTKKRTHQLIILAGTGFLFAMAFISQFRREVLIEIALVLIYIVITNIGNLRRGSIWLLLALIGFFFLVLQPSPIFQERLSELNNVVEGTDTRLMSLKAGVTAILDSPLLGTGPSNYESTAYRVMGPNYPSWYYHSYNGYIYYAVQSGIIGLGGFILVLYGVYLQIKKSWSLQGQASPQAWIIRSALPIMMILIVSLFFGNYTDMSLPWYLMAMIIAASRMATLPAEGATK